MKTPPDDLFLLGFATGLLLACILVSLPRFLVSVLGQG